MLKRTTLFVMATLLMVLALVGCGGTNTTGSTATTLTLYSSGDVNVQSLWKNTLIPEFQKANPSINIHLVYSVHGSNDQATFARISAAVAAKRDPGIDLLDDGSVLQAAQANLLFPTTSSQVPLVSHVDPALLQAANTMGVPYRASSVVLAYNTQYVSQPPTTLSALFSWIKAHPGKFTYNTPDSGGSGSSFVEAALKTGIQASDKQTFVSSYEPALETQWESGLQLLKGLKSSIYNNGFYPNGNTAVLQLLASGSIWVAPVWSDMALTALATHQLPASVKLIQLDPPFDGGPAYIGIPRYTTHTQQAYTFLNWLLTPDVQAQIIDSMHGYPGVQWSYVPAAVQKQYASIAKSYDTGFSSKFSADMHKKWQTEVAGG